MSVLGFIKRWSKEFDDPYTTKLLFTSLVRPNLEYCSIVWSPQYQVHMKYLEHRLDSYSSLSWNPLIENMFSTYSPLELNQHRMLLSSDSDTNELSASFGIALSFMSSRIPSSLCSSSPLSVDAISSALFLWPSQNRHASVRKSFTYSQFDCTLNSWNDDLNLPIKIRTVTLRKVL